MNSSLFKTLLAYTFALLLLFLLYHILSPLLGTMVWAGAIGVITMPVYKKLLNRCHGREIVAAAIMTAVVFMTGIIPLICLIFILSQEAAVAYKYLENVNSTNFALANILNHPAVIPWMERFRQLSGTLGLEPDLDTMLLPAVKKGLETMLNYSTGILKDFFRFLFKLVLMVIMLFFFYKDGASALEYFLSVVTIRDELKKRIIETIKRVLAAIMYGIVLTCLVQGALGGLGFHVAGLPSPVLFGALMAICALIPFIGTALIWLPGALYLLMHGQTIHALLLAIWGVVVVSGIDNIIRPLFISGMAKLHILVIVFGVLGGILAFGITGVVAGPVILAIFLVFFEESRQEKIVAGDNNIIA